MMSVPLNGITCNHNIVHSSLTTSFTKISMYEFKSIIMKEKFSILSLVPGNCPLIFCVYNVNCSKNFM